MKGYGFVFLGIENVESDDIGIVFFLVVSWRIVIVIILGCMEGG